jgi:hypothetical protein
MLREFTLIARIFPNVLGAAFEHFGLYEGIGPQGVEQFVACNQPAGVFHQIIQEANAFGINRVRSSFPAPVPRHRHWLPYPTGMDETHSSWGPQSALTVFLRTRLILVIQDSIENGKLSNDRNSMLLDCPTTDRGWVVPPQDALVRGRRRPYHNPFD